MPDSLSVTGIACVDWLCDVLCGYRMIEFTLAQLRRGVGLQGAENPAGGAEAVSFCLQTGTAVRAHGGIETFQGDVRCLGKETFSSKKPLYLLKKFPRLISNVPSMFDVR